MPSGQQWVKQQLDREAVMLEIRASQESLWEAYAGAAQELASTFIDRKAPPADADAATTVRQHADQAARFAERLGKLADATERLQTALNEDQRKIFDRIVRSHTQFHPGYPDEHWRHGNDREAGDGKPMSKSAQARSKK